jgi:uncharacterized membrane protein
VPRRRTLLLVVWVSFLADLLVGAGLLISRDERLQAVGLGMIVLAALVLVGLTLAFYLQNRRGPAA